MLILTRKVGEEIFINENIRIAVHRIQGSRVRLAIDAPDDVAVLRSELVFDFSVLEEESCREQVAEANLCSAT